MKRHSIKFKFFVAISAVALVFIGVLLLLNLFFYDDYYLMTRKTELRDTYQTVNKSYDGDLDTTASTLDALESQSAIRFALVDRDGVLVYASFFSMEQSRQHSPDFSPEDGFSPPPFTDGLPDFGNPRIRGASVVFSVLSSTDLSTVSPSRLLTVSLRGNEQYLCLVGALGDEYLISYMPYAYIEQNSTFNLLFLLIAGGCALLICLVCGYIISRAFTRPLIEMGSVANSMARFDFSKKYEGRETDEIGQLGDSLNRLSAYLERTIGELQQSNDQLAQEIREKERVDNMRREFIVNVSHELKTPIALIQGYAEGLTAGVADDPADRAFYCGTVADEADHMNKLVMQLLSLSKLELGAEQTYLEDVDLHALCGEAVRKTAVLCESRGLTVGYENTGVTAHTDSGLIEQVLMNYLSNAIRYTGDGGHIELSAEKTASGVRLAVFNEGDGLPEAELDNIWEKFYRTDRARTREAGGTGIGLSLVRAIAGTLHSSCGARNAPGGIEFWFEVPVAPPSAEKT